MQRLLFCILSSLSWHLLYSDFDMTFFCFRNHKTSGFLFPGPNQKYHVHVPTPSCQRCHELFHFNQCFGVAKVTFYDLETMILKGTDFQHLQQQLKARHKDTKNASRTSIRNFWFRQSGLFWLARGRGLCVWVHFHPMFFASCQRHAFANTRLHLLHGLRPFVDPACLKLDFRSDTDIFAGSNSLVAWYLGTDTVLSALALDARTFLVPFLLVLRACEFSRMGAHVLSCDDYRFTRHPFSLFGVGNSQGNLVYHPAVRANLSVVKKDDHLPAEFPKKLRLISLL